MKSALFVLALLPVMAMAYEDKNICGNMDPEYSCRLIGGENFGSVDFCGDHNTDKYSGFLINGAWMNFQFAKNSKTSLVLYFARTGHIELKLDVLKNPNSKSNLQLSVASADHPTQSARYLCRTRH
jgi:hypothetical protein